MLFSSGGGGGGAGCQPPSFDIWSFGVLLFRMCADRELFLCYRNSQHIISDVDKQRLKCGPASRST